MNMNRLSVLPLAHARSSPAAAATVLALEVQLQVELPRELHVPLLLLAQHPLALRLLLLQLERDDPVLLFPARALRLRLQCSMGLDGRFGCRGVRDGEARLRLRVRVRRGGCVPERPVGEGQGGLVPLLKVRVWEVGA